MISLTMGGERWRVLAPLGRLHRDRALIEEQQRERMQMTAAEVR